VHARVTYLLCELAWRQAAAGRIEDNTIRLPLTQTELADALGLTPVYVNRILQAFRREQLITLRERRLVLHQPERLRAISELTPEYLQLGTTPAEIMHYFDPLGARRRASPRVEQRPALLTVILPHSYDTRCQCNSIRGKATIGGKVNACRFSAKTGGVAAGAGSREAHDARPAHLPANESAGKLTTVNAVTPTAALHADVAQRLLASRLNARQLKI
jgi:transcriptional regulator with XRE-family HTH domain